LPAFISMTSAGDNRTLTRARQTLRKVRACPVRGTIFTWRDAVMAGHRTACRLHRCATLRLLKILPGILSNRGQPRFWELHPALLPHPPHREDITRCLPFLWRISSTYSSSYLSARFENHYALRMPQITRWITSAVQRTRLTFSPLPSGKIKQRLGYCALARTAFASQTIRPKYRL